MNFLVLTQLTRTLQETTEEKTIYLNPIHIREFHERYMGNFGIRLTSISLSDGSFNPIFVKETPDEILHQLTAC